MEMGRLIIVTKYTDEEVDTLLSRFHVKYPVVALIGSLRFTDEFFIWQEKFALKGFVVLLPVFTKKEGHDEMFEEMGYQRINMADLVFVINKEGYIGTSTQLEINHAVLAGKEVSYLTNEGGPHGYK